MLENLYRQTVRIFRIQANTSDGSGAAQYAEVLEESTAAPLPLKCKIEEVAARSVTQQGSEQTNDATLLYRVGTAPALYAEDLVVLEDGRQFRVNRIETNRPVGSRVTYGRATLSRSKVAVPKVKNFGL